MLASGENWKMFVWISRAISICLMSVYCMVVLIDVVFDNSVR